jgi:TRAP-type C4-dicarboxylate transport system substrate-binding protein
MSVTVKWGILKRLKEYKVISEKFKDKVKTLTRGQVQIEIVLLDEVSRDPLKEVSYEELDIVQITSDHLRELTNQEWLKCWETPFLFEDRDHVEKYIKSDRSKKMLKTIENEKILPLTYSYAGGFMSIVKRKGGELGTLKEHNFAIHGFDNNKFDEINLSYLYMKLPFTVLMYEVPEVGQLKQLKENIEVELTNHLVQARITLVSKTKLSKIPEEYREKFLSLLESLLDEERQVIYNRSDRNTVTLLEDQSLKVNLWGDDKKEKYFKNLRSEGSEELNQEIDYILKLKRGG